jgi:hypothetical protein
MKNVTSLLVECIAGHAFVALSAGFAVFAVMATPARALQDASAPEDVALTIRADGFAEVREVRSAQLVPGDNRLRVYDVSPRIVAETVAARALASPDLLDLREQSIWFEVLDPERALERLAGRPASLYRWHENKEEKLDGRLLFPPVVPGPKGDVRVPLYLEQPNGKIRLLDEAEVELDALPAGDWNRTRVDWRVTCKRPDRYRIELTYLSAGLAWRADASLRLAAGGESGDVAFVATVRNETGIAWRQTRVGFAESDALLGEGRRADAERTSPFFYSYDDPVTLEARRSTQLVLASVHDAKVVATPTLLVGREGTQESVAVRRRYDVANTAAAGLGRALPAATARTIVVDAKNRPVPVGTCELPASAAGETLSFAGPVEPGLIGRVHFEPANGPDGKRTAAVSIWSERAEATTVDLLIALAPAEQVVDAGVPVETVRAGLARIALPVPPHAHATAAFTVARP